MHTNAIAAIEQPWRLLGSQSCGRPGRLAAGGPLEPLSFDIKCRNGK
jgi:hypothetical protein